MCLLLLFTCFRVVANNTETNSIYVSNCEKKIFSISDVSFEKENGFIKINVNESTDFLKDSGKPMLPFVVKDFILPNYAELNSLDCRIISFTEEQIEGTIVPAPRPVLKIKVDSEEENIIDFDKNLYSSSEFYPKNWYDYTLTSGLEGVRLSVRFYPIRYNPSEGIIKKASDIELKISYDSFLKNNVFSEEYDMVVISPDCFSNILKSLINHKNDIGTRTFLKTTEDIYDEYPGRDEQECIKHFIKDAIESCNISYVLLVGGMKGIKREWYLPVRETNLDDGGDSGCISDLYYADVYKINQTSFEKEFDDWDPNKDDVFAEWSYNSSLPEDLIDCDPDVCIGRLACRSASELRTVVKKIIYYEKENKLFTNNKKIVCVGGDTVTPLYDDEDVYEGEFMGDIVAQIMHDEKDYDIVKLYVSTGMLKNPLSVIKELNFGSDLVYFNGHGNPYIWSTNPTDSSGYNWINGLNTNQMNLLFNKYRLPIVFVVGCHNSQFDVTPLNLLEGIKNQGLNYFSLKDRFADNFWSINWIPECWSWKFVSVGHGGAIATIGNTGLGWGLQGDDIAFSDWLSLRFFEVIGNRNATTVGEAHSLSISDYVSTFDVNGEDKHIDRKTVDSLVLLGDPSIKIK